MSQLKDINCLIIQRNVTSKLKESDSNLNFSPVMVTVVPPLVPPLAGLT